MHEILWWFVRFQLLVVNPKLDENSVDENMLVAIRDKSISLAHLQNMFCADELSDDI